MQLLQPPALSLSPPHSSFTSAPAISLVVASTTGNNNGLGNVGLAAITFDQNTNRLNNKAANG